MSVNISKIIGMGLLSIAVLIGPFASPTSAMVDPAASYCSALGYEYSIGLTKRGEVAFCRLPNDQIVDARNFLSGKVALEWSYCAKEGYEAKRVEDSEICKDCTVCVLEDGTEIEVTKLMGLDFRETWCGDGTCGTSEDYGTCPEDCPSGGIDEYCDGVSDGECDPDCAVFGGDDPDCEGYTTTTTTEKKARWQIAYNEIWGARKEKNLARLRMFRDEFLLNNEAGRDYTSLLYDNSSEIARLLLKNPSLRAQTKEVVADLLPGIDSLLTNGQMEMSRDTLEKVKSLLGHLESNASPGLKTAIRKVKKDINREEVFKKLGIAVSQ